MATYRSFLVVDTISVEYVVPEFSQVAARQTASEE